MPKFNLYCYLLLAWLLVFLASDLPILVNFFYLVSNFIKKYKGVEICVCVFVCAFIFEY